jgi:hypothetical protein
VFQIKKYAIGVATVCMGILVLLGCEGKQEMTDPKAALESAAEAYWTKRFLDKDYKATYEMELDKDAIPYERYEKIVYNAGQIDYQSVTVKSIEIKDNKGQVELSVRCIIPPVPKAMDLGMGDEWVLTSNQWKHVLPNPDKDGTKPPEPR